MPFRVSSRQNTTIDQNRRSQSSKIQSFKRFSMRAAYPQHTFTHEKAIFSQISQKFTKNSSIPRFI